MKRFAEMLADARSRVPWFAAPHIAGSLHVPRGVLEQACGWGFDDTVAELAGGRADRRIQTSEGLHVET